MHRKLIGTCAALVALAALSVMPAISSAQTLVDTVGGVETTVPVGTKIVGYSEGTSILTGAGGALKVECNENILTGAITQNAAGKNIIGTIEDAWFQGPEAGTKCKSNLGAATVTLNTTNGTLNPKTHWCIQTNQGTDTFKVEPRNCGGEGGSFTFVIHAGGLSCGFTRTANITGTFKTGSDVGGVVTPATFTAGVAGEPEISFSTFKHPEIAHSIFCPASGALDNLTFNLYTDASNVTSNVYSQAADTAAPTYITAP